MWNPNGYKLSFTYLPQWGSIAQRLVNEIACEIDTLVICVLGQKEIGRSEISMKTRGQDLA